MSRSRLDGAADEGRPSTRALSAGRGGAAEAEEGGEDSGDGELTADSEDGDREAKVASDGLGELEGDVASKPGEGGAGEAEGSEQQLPDAAWG